MPIFQNAGLTKPVLPVGVLVPAPLIREAAPLIRRRQVVLTPRHPPAVVPRVLTTWAVTACLIQTRLSADRLAVPVYQALARVQLIRGRPLLTRHTQHVPPVSIGTALLV